MILPAYEWAIRLAVFTGVFALMVWAEHRAPMRVLTVAKQQRWLANLGLLVVNSVVVRVFFPGAVVGVAVFAEQSGLGLLTILDLPEALAFVISLLLLDLTIYLQHMLFHRVPALWRLHSVHHADLDFDVTTAIRFHPVEMLLSMVIKGVVILALGPPWLAVLVFEVMLSAAAVFNHANVRLPPRAERWLRWILVTPDMHRVHHSAGPQEHNNNFGSNVSWWDRLFGTYVAQPRLGHAGMMIGLQRPRCLADCANLTALLAMPFRRANRTTNQHS